MIALLDVNVLVALAWPNHVHHVAAHEWFRQHRVDGWATCPVTQSGFVRVSSNQRMIPGAKSPAEAIGVLREMTHLEHHVFWTDDVSLVESPWVAGGRLAGYRQVTDAHLLALALTRGGRLATFDGGVRQLVPEGADSNEVVTVLQVR